MVTEDWRKERAISLKKKHVASRRRRSEMRGEREPILVTSWRRIVADSMVLKTEEHNSLHYCLLVRVLSTERENAYAGLPGYVRCDFTKALKGLLEGAQNFWALDHNTISTHT